MFTNVNISAETIAAEFIQELINEVHDETRTVWESALVFSMAQGLDALDSLEALKGDLVGAGVGSRWN